MNWVHIHLITNHIPVIGVIIGLIILTIGMLWKSQDLKRFSLYYFVALGAITLLVYFTGEPAEEAIEDLPGISKEIIETHEEASIYGLIFIEAIALFSLAGLASKTKIIARSWYSKTLLLLVLLASISMARIAYLGGQIRHFEINQQTMKNND